MSTKSLAAISYQGIGMSASNMDGPQDDLPRIIGNNVRRKRETRGWSRAELARKVHVHNYTIEAVEIGKTQKSKYLPDIARVLGCDIWELDPTQVPPADSPPQPIVNPTRIPPKIPISELVGAADLPVYRSRSAGDGALVMTSDPVCRTVRPANLVQVEGAYGVIVDGGSMEPAIRAGDTVCINPHIPPQRGDWCVFRSEKLGEFQSLIKEYIAQTGTHWRVKRYQPETKEYLIKKTDWPGCHVVVALYRR